MVIPEGYAQVNFRFGGLAAPTGAEVVIGVDNTAGDKAPSVIADAAAAAWVDNMLELQCFTLDLVSVLAKKGPNDTGPFAEVTVGENGGSSTASSPPQVSILFTKETVHGGRRGRGRMYSPSYPEGNVDADGTISSGLLSVYQSHADDFLTQLGDAELPMVLLHGETVTAAPYLVTALRAQNKVATQKRRLRR